MKRSSSEKLSGSMRQAAVTALFRFFSRADLSVTFSLIDTIFTWKGQVEAGVAHKLTVPSAGHRKVKNTSPVT